MGFQIDGVDITGVNLDGQAVNEVQIDGVTVWTSAPAFTLDEIYLYSGGMATYTPGSDCEVYLKTHFNATGLVDGLYTVEWEVLSNKGRDLHVNTEDYYEYATTRNTVNDTTEVKLSITQGGTTQSLSKTFTAERIEHPYFASDKWSTELQPNLDGQRVYAMETDQNGTWVAGDGIGRAQYSLDDGQTWTALPVGLTETGEAVGKDINNIKYHNGTWIAVLDSGFASRSTNGINWTALPRGLNTGTTKHIQNVGTDYNGTWIAVFDDLWASRSIDDGQTWTALPRDLNTGCLEYNSNNSFLSIAGASNGTWIVGTQEGFSSRSTDNGDTWVRLPRWQGNPDLVVGVDDRDTNAICTDGNGKWLAGGQSGHIMASIDDGETWYKNSSPGSTIYGIETDGNGIWLLSRSSGTLTFSIDDTTTWSRGASDLMYTGNIANFGYNSNTNKWIFGQYDGYISQSEHPAFADKDLITNFPTEEPTEPEVGTYWYRGTNDPVWWNGTTWEGI